MLLWASVLILASSQQGSMTSVCPTFSSTQSAASHTWITYIHYILSHNLKVGSDYSIRDVYMNYLLIDLQCILKTSNVHILHFTSPLGYISHMTYMKARKTWDIKVYKDFMINITIVKAYTTYQYMGCKP